ncbi:probable glutathione S-transferase [Cajanus cajan]|nr:probable glutathione S-transferase [Cajanus cajan]
MAEIKLHGFWYSPFTWRVKWTLELKGISYENIEEDRFNMSTQLFQYNPVYKRTPVLIHDRKPICESMIIVEYIDQIWPHNPLIPTDSYEKSQAQFWVKYADDMIFAVESIVRSNNGEEKEKAIEKIWEYLRVVEVQCFNDEKNFFGGDTINIVDIAFGSIVKFLEVLEDALGVKVLEYEKFPHFHSWYNNFKNTPIIKENLPDQSKMVAFLKFTLFVMPFTSVTTLSCIGI